jgi:hypothetical protein
MLQKFRRRWFVLQDRKLHYFLSNEQSIPLGVVDLQQVAEIIEQAAESWWAYNKSLINEYIDF